VRAPASRRGRRRLAARARRRAATDHVGLHGRFLLAGAGLLDDKRATTHWQYCDSLRSRHPKVDVDAEPIFVRDGRIATSAGVTTGIDLALALVEEDRGRDVALAIARGLVMFLRRPGGQSQFSAQLPAGRAPRAAARGAAADRRAPRGGSLGAGARGRREPLAPAVHPGVHGRDRDSAGSLCRSRTPGTARRLLEDTADGIAEVARRAGYGTPEAMRRAFLQALDVSPAEYRRRF
jgi:transcriptional regulator GlxA family with amidase domain